MSQSAAYLLPGEGERRERAVIGRGKFRAARVVPIHLVAS